MKHILVGSGVLIFLFGLVPAALGDQISLNRSGFLAAAGASGMTITVEGFESFSTCPDCSSGGPSPVTSLATSLFTVTTTPTSGGTSFFCIGTAAGGPHPTAGNNALIAGSMTGDPWILTFQLAAPAYAVGFDLTDAAEGGEIRFSTDAGDSVVMAEGGLPSGNVLFFGFISDTPFTQFQLTNTAVWDGWGIDEVAVGTCSEFPGGGHTGGCFPGPHPFVPDPASTLVLFGTGLAGLAAFARYKRR
jgi:hypothetical protein